MNFKPLKKGVIRLTRRAQYGELLSFRAHNGAFNHADFQSATFALFFPRTQIITFFSVHLHVSATSSRSYMRLQCIMHSRATSEARSWSSSNRKIPWAISEWKKKEKKNYFWYTLVSQQRFPNVFASSCGWKQKSERVSLCGNIHWETLLVQSTFMTGWSKRIFFLYIMNIKNIFWYTCENLINIFLNGFRFDHATIS